MARRAVVTGAFSYLGSAVARALLARGWAVRTLTNRRPPSEARGIEAFPLRFDPESLARGLAGADLLVNTYWVRLPYGGDGFSTAVANTERLVRAAEEPGPLDVDAAGPHMYAFADYVRLVARAMGLRRRLVPAPVGLSLLALRALGVALGDVVLAREEWLGLEQELLVSHRPPLGTESVEAWLLANGSSLGRRYVNDRRRHVGAARSDPIGSR